MYNILIAIAAGAVTELALFLPGLLKAYEASAPAVLVAIITYFVLARRSFKKLEKLMTDASKVLNNNPPKFEKAIGILKQGYKLNRWQIGVKSQVSAQIGMILFLKKDNKEAAEYLNESKELAHWMAAAMLGVIYFKQKKYDEMKSAFEVAVKKSSKETLAWSLYAYCLEELGKRDEAMAILNRGIKKVKDHQKLDENLLALQNNKKMKMRQLYKEQWYQFQIEKPPAIVMENQFQSFSKKRRRHIQ